MLVVIPPAGPPVTLPLGWLLPGGLVSLDPGIQVIPTWNRYNMFPFFIFGILQVEGAYWQSLDRRVYSNGTILYEGTGVVEESVLIFGTVGGGGAITPLPHIQAAQQKLLEL